MIVSLSTSDHGNRTFLVLDDATRQGVIVDPSFDTAVVERALDEHRAAPVATVLTHGHIDHIAGAAACGLPVWIHADDAPLLGDNPLNGAPLFGVAWEAIEPARLLSDGETITLGETTLRVIHTPGHSPGSVTFDVNGGEALITGDLLFRGAVGRTDLPGGDQATMIESLRRVTEMFDDPAVHPGHGEATTLDAERRTNPFLREWLK